MARQDYKQKSKIFEDIKATVITALNRIAVDACFRVDVEKMKNIAFEYNRCYDAQQWDVVRILEKALLDKIVGEPHG